jgi:biopolymer transport protein ExbD
MITGPLELQSRLSPPPRNLDAFFWVSAGVVALLFGVLGSRFVMAPGFLVEPGGPSAELPAAATAQALAETHAVVSYRNDQAILFEGIRYSRLADLQPELEKFAKKHPGSVLLLLAERGVSLQGAADLSAMAGAAGFARVLVPTEPPKGEGARAR